MKVGKNSVEDKIKEEAMCMCEKVSSGHLFYEKMILSTKNILSCLDL